MQLQSQIFYKNAWKNEKRETEMNQSSYAEKLKKLQEFGLSEYQARVYLALLELGTATASQIPPISKVPRTRIYTTMSQLHEKGLVQIIPETPLKYKPLPFEEFLEKRISDLRAEAKMLEVAKEELSREFMIKKQIREQKAGGFEAILGRRNLRAKLYKMYSNAKSEVYFIGSAANPMRLANILLPVIEEKAQSGIAFKFAFPVNARNSEKVKLLSRYAAVKHLEKETFTHLTVIDSAEALLAHAIPDDEDPVRGSDVAIWIDDEAIVSALRESARDIWEHGVNLGAIALAKAILGTVGKSIESLKVNPQPILKLIGKQVGEQIAGEFKSRKMDDLLKEIAHYWKAHDLGQVSIQNSTIVVRNCIECENMPNVNSCLCAFIEGVLESIFDRNLNVKSSVNEVECWGTGHDYCKFIIAFNL
jgi:sugar-specific transcriptional regulator TrmB/predicted hydrocarbon binding protein